MEVLLSDYKRLAKLNSAADQSNIVASRARIENPHAPMTSGSEHPSEQLDQLSEFPALKEYLAKQELLAKRRHAMMGV